jgi:hypothetical protein
LTHIVGSLLAVETVSVNSANATEGYNAAGAQTTSIKGLIIVAVTVVREHGFTTAKVKLDGLTSEEPS